MASVNMRDVARHANVSIATVSHVLNNTRFVKEETRQRVLNSIAELDYRPDAIARSFKTRQRNLIAFVVPDIANAFFATLIESVEQVVSREGYQLLVTNTKETLQRELDSIRMLGSGMVDGFILASTAEQFSDISGVVPSNIPLVLLDRKLPGCSWDTVTVENYASMYRGVEHLIKLGHTKIGYIAGLPRISTTAERLKAYHDAMNHYGLNTQGIVCIGNSMSNCVRPHVLNLLDQKCTALVVANNVMATEAMLEMIERGVHPGSDIELLGYKDSDQAQYGLQHMNLICQPTAVMGRTAGEQMLQRLKYPDMQPRSTVLQPTFIPRNA